MPEGQIALFTWLTTRWHICSTERLPWSLFGQHNGMLPQCRQDNLDGGQGSPAKIQAICRSLLNWRLSGCEHQCQAEDLTDDVWDFVFLNTLQTYLAFAEHVSSPPKLCSAPAAMLNEALAEKEQDSSEDTGDLMQDMLIRAQLFGSDVLGCEISFPQGEDAERIQASLRAMCF